MQCTVSTRNIWKTTNAAFMHDLSTDDGAQSYVAACKAAAEVPPLTNQDFYQNMLDANKHLFGSKKQLQRRKAADLAEASDEVVDSGEDQSDESDEDDGLDWIFV